MYGLPDPTPVRKPQQSGTPDRPAEILQPLEALTRDIIARTTEALGGDLTRRLH